MIKKGTKIPTPLSKKEKEAVSKVGVLKVLAIVQRECIAAYKIAVCASTRHQSSA